MRVLMQRNKLRNSACGFVIKHFERGRSCTKCQRLQGSFQGQHHLHTSHFYLPGLRVAIICKTHNSRSSSSSSSRHPQLLWAQLQTSRTVCAVNSINRIHLSLLQQQPSTRLSPVLLPLPAAVKEALLAKGVLPSLQASVRSQIFNVLLGSEVGG